MNADNIPGEELLKGRKKIRAVVPVDWKLETFADYQLAAAEAMRAQGAIDIKDFREVKPLPREHQKFGKKKIRAFSATAIKKED